MNAGSFSSSVFVCTTKSSVGSVDPRTCIGGSSCCDVVHRPCVGCGDAWLYALALRFVTGVAGNMVVER